VLEGVRMAGLQAAKRTSSLIPLCHPLPLGEVTVDLGIEADALEISVTAETWARTGVEMEALTACALAGLALIDLCDPTGAMIESVALLEKSGGRSGAWAAGRAVARVTTAPTARVRSDGAMATSSSTRPGRRPTAPAGSRYEGVNQDPQGQTGPDLPHMI